MISSRHFLALVLSLGAISLASLPAGAVQIDKVLPFTGLDHARIRVALYAAGDTGDVELHGRIVPVKPTGGPALWEGSLGKATLDPDKAVTVETTVKDLKPKLWSPGSPSLYLLIVEARQAGNLLDSQSVRFGFRTTEAKDGHILLNGKPVFLRGIAINPPGRGVPVLTGHSRKFAEDYVRFMRAHNVNIIRLEPQSPVWFDVCDEMGMMIYQGVYGSPPGHENLEDQSKNKVPPLDAAVDAYRRLFEDYVSHPSIVIYVLSNELPYQGKRGAVWHEFLTQAHAALSKEFPVPFIGNAGYGQGREGDINDVHRYWGWYYNSHLTYFNLRDPLLFGDKEKALKQPLTFSECVGAFTGPNGQVNSTFRKQLGAQLNWTGHAEDQVGETQAYQAFIFKHAAESFRTMRASNPRLSGLMPFTILFRNWNGITSFGQMGHNANAEQMTRSYSPVLLSWENWTPNVYAGTTLKAFAHVVNDAEDFSDLTGAALAYEVLDPRGERIAGAGGAVPLNDVKYYGTSRTPIEIRLHRSWPTGTYTIRGVVSKYAQRVAENSLDVFIAGTEWTLGGASGDLDALELFDPSGRTAEAFAHLQIPFVDANLANPRSRVPLVIGEGVWGLELQPHATELEAAVSHGRRLLVLGQPRDRFDSSWLPSKIAFNKQSNNDPTYEKRTRPMSDGMHVNPMRPWHPVLKGISRDNLKWWSDHIGWDQSKPGFPDIYPVGYGFRLTDEKDLADTAIIANYDRGLEAIAVAEMFEGDGSVVMTSFRLIDRIGKDPVADRMLRNLVAYVSSSESREVHPLIDKPILWGNYPTERGVVVEPLGGLVVNNRWQRPPTAPNAKPLPDNEGAWNVMPGQGFVPHGRRVFGPWSYTNATGIRDLSDPGQAEMMKRQQAGEAGTAGINPPELDDADNAIKRETKASPTGTGQFWCRVPAGRKWCVTKVENPSDNPGKIEMQVNGGKAEAIEVAKGQTASVKCPIGAGATVVNVKFTADKSLVLLETSFE